MVKITVYVEGGTISASDDAAAQTVDSSSAFREGFYQLFSQKLPRDKFDLIVQPIGPVSQTRAYLQKVANGRGAILIDLDGPKDERATRLQSYSPLDTSSLFFMIQEMEAWILSQPEKLDEYARKEGITRRRAEEEIAQNALIRGVHPEALPDPSGKLKTLFRQYFTVEKRRGGKRRDKPKAYSKTKDGPRLIGILALDELMQDFDEADKLIRFISA